MAKRTPTTFAKRQREMDNKRKAAEKRQRRAERRAAGPKPEDESPPLVCRPFTDE